MSFLIRNWQHTYTYANVTCDVTAPLEFIFLEQSYSSLHSGQSLAWDHVRGDIDDPAAPSPISAELLPIPAVLSRSLRRSAAADRCATC